MKRCIYHYMAPLQEKAGVGSGVRPFQMMNAFRELGYEVEVVAGYSKQRKAKIKEIKKNLKNGVKYDFFYAESSNDPVMFSDKDHLPRHPFMDRSFFRACRKQKIPVGLFYRDIHWRFPQFKDSTSFLQRLILVWAYGFEEKRLRNCLDLLYLPTLRMQNYVLQGLPASALPPGGVVHPQVFAKKSQREAVKNGVLKVFYVGGLSQALYNNLALFQAVQQTPNVELTVCTRKGEWEQLKDQYEPYLCDRIQVVHESGEQLIARYQEADIMACCMKKCDYLDFAMPIKVFESFSYATPILVADHHCVAQLVEGEGLGWNTGNDWESIAQTLSFLRDHPEEVLEKTQNVIQAVPNHTWLARAKQVAEELTALKK